MKKGICFVLVLALLVTTVAFAADTLSFIQEKNCCEPGGEHRPYIADRGRLGGSNYWVGAQTAQTAHSFPNSLSLYLLYKSLL